ncbi:MAG: hypothetical protein K5681_04885 [Treponema sp.]|nr:hypothetical protein [Treponema sp.]
MKKLKSLSFIAFILFILTLSACKSLPEVQNRQVKAIELLDNNSTFYIAIPKAADSDLIERIIQNNVKNISESDVKLISSHIDKVYCGLNRHKNSIEIQSAIDASVPVKMVPKILSSKNGWNKITYTVESSQKQYQIYDYNSLQMSFPASNLACIGRGMDYMINKFDAIASLPAEDQTACYEIGAPLYEYLNSAENEIRFYANKPSSFLTILTGAQLNLQLIDVKGSFVTDQLHPSQYILKLHFAFKSEKMLKAGKALLVLAFGLTNSQSTVIEGSNELIIEGIKLDKKQLYKLLVL